jgi:predicted transposase/invertase (TIGR01784 family)
LIRVNEFNKVAKSPLEEWVNYLKNGVIESDTKAPGLQEARERLKYYEMSDSERHAYDEHLNAIMIQNDVLGNAKLEGIAEGMAKGMAKGIEKGRAEGKEEGLAEGVVKGKIEIAKTMLAKGMSVEMIAEITGLTAAEITKTTKNI